MPMIYEIRIQDHLDTQWSGWLQDIRVSTTFSPTGKPITVLTGEIPDQSALSGILIQLSDLGYSVISVNQLQGEDS